MARKLYGDLEIQTGGQLKIDSPDTTFNSVSYTWPGDNGTSGQVLTTDGNGVLSWTTVGFGSPLSLTVILEKALTQPSDLVVVTGKARWYPVQDIELISVQAHVDTPATGQSILVDVNKNGSTILTGSPNIVEIAAGANSSAIIPPGTTSVTVGDYVTVDVDQIGSGTAGADLVVQFVYVAA